MEEKIVVDSAATFESDDNKKKKNEAKAKRKEFMSKYFSTRKLTTLSVFTGLSIVLYMFVKIPLPIFPSFLKLQFSDIPALIAAVIFGPIEGIIVVLCRFLLKLPTSDTFYVGELADLVIGSAFVLPLGLIYRKIRSKKGVAIGLALGVLLSTLVAIIMNRYVLVPFYASMYGGMPEVVKSVGKLYKNVTIDSFYSFYLWIGVLPFNLLRGIACGIMTFFLYGYLEKALNHIFHKR